MSAKKTAKKVAKKSPAKVTKKPATKKESKKKAPAKKTTAKTKQTKKAAPKKTTTKKAATAKSLIYAPEGEQFWANDGQIFDSLISLNEALNQMEDEVYRYHALGTQNDFAEWVEHVLQDAQCAQALRKSRKAATAQAAITRRLKIYIV